MSHWWATWKYGWDWEESSRTVSFPVMRRDSSVLVDTKTERNAHIIANMKELWGPKVNTSWDVRMAFISKTEFVTPSEIEPMIMDQAEDMGSFRRVHIHQNIQKFWPRKWLRQVNFWISDPASYMMVGFKKIKIQKDLPKPRQCQQCWKYGQRVVQGLPLLSNMCGGWPFVGRLFSQRRSKLCQTLHKLWEGRPYSFR